MIVSGFLNPLKVNSQLGYVPVNSFEAAGNYCAAIRAGSCVTSWWWEGAARTGTHTQLGACSE